MWIAASLPVTLFEYLGCFLKTFGDFRRQIWMRTVFWLTETSQDYTVVYVFQGWQQFNLVLGESSEVPLIKPYIKDLHSC